MSDKKLKFSQQVKDIILHLCRLAFNIKQDKEIENLFGLNVAQLKSVIEKTTFALPDDIFGLSPKKLEEIENIFAREFIFFQVQEKANDPRYQEDLNQFSRVFSRDIQRQFGKLTQANIKEE